MFICQPIFKIFVVMLRKQKVTSSLPLSTLLLKKVLRLTKLIRVTGLIGVDNPGLKKLICVTGVIGCDNPDSQN